jgi:hypothetical protein
MLIAFLFVPHLIVSQTNVHVTKTDGGPLADVRIIIERDGQEVIGKPILTDRDGRARIETKGLDRRDTINAKKSGYIDDGHYWQDVADEDPIEFRMELDRRPRPCTVYYQIQKIVTVRHADGRESCQAVYETKAKECPPAGTIEYRLPSQLPPMGFKYEFSHAITVLDVVNKRYIHTPYWRIVPACAGDPITYPRVYLPSDSSTPCACQ